MADYTGAIVLSQRPTSDDDSLEHAPQSFRTLYAFGGDGGVGGDSSKCNTPWNKIMNIDHQYHHYHLITPPSSETTVRKRRGRPPGSKNRPKPPVVITRENDSAMKVVILKISAGSDIIDTVISFAHRNNVGVSIISATGSVSNVTLRNPVYHSSPVSLHGPFGLLSLSGSFIASSDRTPQLPSSYSFGVTLAGVQGQVLGGIVGGKVIVATEVILVVATFTNPDFHKLLCEADNKNHLLEIESGIRDNNGGGGSEMEVGGMPMPDHSVPIPIPLNCQISPDVMLWDPSSRPY